MNLSIIQAIILGIIQGLTEFLPISSSAHLLIVRDVFHFPDPSKLFDIMLHLGTLLALLAYFWKDLYSLVKGAIDSIRRGKFYGNPDIDLLWFLIISTIPAGVFGCFFEEPLENIKNVYWISSALILYGILLLLSDIKGDKNRSLSLITWKDALVIGLMQAIALFPGVSRSGICMTAALMLGFSREASARYAFLTSIPLIGGISAHGVLKLLKHHPRGGEIFIYFLGVITAAVAGFLCIKYLLDYLKKGTFLGFTIYRSALGLILIILGLTGKLG